MLVLGRVDTITPRVERPATRMFATRQRINWLLSDTSMIWPLWLDQTELNFTGRPVLLWNEVPD